MSEQTGRARGRSLFDREPSAADQVATAQALLVIIQTAAKRGLPPISWDLGELGSSLVARAQQQASQDTQDGGFDYPATRALRRSVFQQYVDLLHHLYDTSVARFGVGTEALASELSVWPERTDGHGTTHLWATLKNATIPLGRDRRKRLLNIVVIADLEADPEAAS